MPILLRLSVPLDMGPPVTSMSWKLALPPKYCTSP